MWVSVHAPFRRFSRHVTVASRPLYGSTSSSLRQTHLMRRFFSSQEDELATLRELTSRVLAIQDHISPKAWSAFETAFDMWTCHPVTQEGVEWGWKLLDRMVEEERRRMQQDREFECRLTVGWLHRMVGAYCVGEGTMEPDSVLAKLEGYAPILMIDAKTRSMLQESAWQSSSGDETLASAQSLGKPPGEFLRLGDELTGQPDDAPDESFISSQSELIGNQQALIETCQAASIRLQKAPLGSMTDNDWDAAERALSQIGRIEWAFKLMHRLTEEERHSESSQPRMTTEWRTTYETIVSTVKRSSFLEKPVGSITPIEWDEAEALLHAWTSKPSRENVASAWKVLDRLVEEEQHMRDKSSDFKSRLNPEWLNRIVEAWCGCSKGGSSFPLDDPINVLIKLNRYAPHLSPDPYTYQMIMAAAVSTTSPSEAGFVSENETISEQKTSAETAQKDEPTAAHRKRSSARPRKSPAKAKYNEGVHKLTKSGMSSASPKAEAI